MFRLQDGIITLQNAVSVRLYMAFLFLFGNDFEEQRIDRFLTEAPEIRYGSVRREHRDMVRERLAAVSRCLRDWDCAYTFDTFSEFLIVQVMRCLMPLEKEWRAFTQNIAFPMLWESCMNYAAELNGGGEGDDDEDLCSEGDGEELYQAIMDLYPLTDSDRWYFYVVFWDTDFEFYNGRPQKHRIPVTDYEAVRFMPGNGSDKREG